MIKGKFVVPPNLSDALEFHRLDAAAQLRVALPGQIIAYDAANRTAQIMVCYNRVYNDGTVKPISCPLVDVPVLAMQGGGILLGLPISAGDECLVIFADINIDAWHANGGQQTPFDRRRHDIADGFALVGPNSLANLPDSFLSATEGGLATDSSKIALDAVTGKATVQAGGQSLLTTMTTLLTSLNAALAALGVDPGLQSATKTACLNAATAATAAITELGAMLQ